MTTLLLQEGIVQSGFSRSAQWLRALFELGEESPVQGCLRRVRRRRAAGNNRPPYPADR